MSVRHLAVAALVAAASTAGLSLTLQAQQSDSTQPPSATRTSRDTTAGHGPAFFTVRGADDERVDASDAPALRRRISLTLIGIPLGMAVQAIGDRAGLETTFSPETIPLGARVSMRADDVTVAAALRWVLVNAHVDVLVQSDGHLTLVTHATTLAQADSSGVLTGELVDGTTGEAVPYGTVTLLGTDLARFTDRAGHFRMLRLVARRYVLRARQIGYAPVDDTVAVARDSTTRLTLRMHRIPAMLRLVRVTGRNKKGCVATGIPDSTVDPVLFTLFAQIRENVDRYDLLLKAYPFRYVREEKETLQRPVRRDSTEFVDTVAYESRMRRPYRVGGLIYRDSVVHQDSVFRMDEGTFCALRPHVPSPEDSTLPLPICPRDYYVARVFEGMQTEVTARRRVMELPTFADLVDPAFLAAHCFEYGGRTGSGSAPLVRVNFQPAKRIKSPDVSGSVYLDADSLILRRAVFEMTKPQAAEPPVARFKVSTTFREVLPLVPVVDSVESEQPLPPLTTSRTALEGGGVVEPGSPATGLGSDRLIGFAFERLTPGEEPSAPPERATIASAATTKPAATLAADPGVPRVHAIFPSDSSCHPTAAVDTISVLLYSTLHGRRKLKLSDSAWSTYTSDVLNAVSEAFALPDTLALSTFSWPFEHGVRKEGPGLDRAVADLAAGAGGSSPFVPPIDSARPPSSTLVVAVLDDAGDPVPFATVRLAGTAERARTDSSGASRMRRLRPGAYVLEVRRIGYTPQDRTIWVWAGGAVTTDTIYTGRMAARLAVVNVQGRNAGPFVAPMMSTVVTLTLGADGSLEDARVAASTGSHAADDLVIAAVQRAAAAHAFPPLRDTADHIRTITADLLVSTAEPAPGEQAVALGRFDAPAWPSVAAAQLAAMPSPPPGLLGDFLMGGPAADTAALEFVVSDRGKLLRATVRLDYEDARPFVADNQERYMRRLLPVLPAFRFDAGRIGGCRVPEFVRQSFGYYIRSQSR